MTALPAPRCLVIGTGSIGRRHIANLRRLRPAATFALVRSGTRRDPFSDDLEAQLYGSVHEALEWRPTLAVVANPSDCHAEVLQPLLRAGIPCFIEKPVVIASDQLDALATVAPLPPTQVGCVLRFLPSLRRLRDHVASGAMGRIVRASLQVGQYLPDWRPTQDYRASYSASTARGGGVVLDLVHEIDLACWLFGDVTLLGAWGDRLSDLEIESEDVATIVLHGERREQIAIQLDYVARTPIRQIYVVGDRGSATWDLIRRCLVLTAPDGAVETVTDGFDVAAAYIDAVGELLGAIEGDGATSLPLPEGLRATRLAIAANALIRSGSAGKC